MPTEFETLLVKMDAGFDKISEKVDGIREDFTNHIPICMDKFAKLDLKVSVRDAVNGVQKEYIKEKKDWGIWFVRGTLGVIFLGALTLLWKLLIGSVKIVGG
jgi:hypothetical protein